MLTTVVTTVATPYGDARLHCDSAADARSLLMLGHGAGGSIDAPDLAAVAAAAVRRGVTVLRVEQPYRVAGRRAPPPAAQLDAAWIAVLAAAVDLGAAPGLAGAPDPVLPLIVGGRSSGARVALRTATALGAAGVVALALPLVTPKGVSRQAELDAVRLPTFILQGDRDPFGMPEAARRRQVVVLPGADHSLRRDPDAVAEAVLRWLTRRRWAWA